MLLLKVNKSLMENNPDLVNSNQVYDIHERNYINSTLLHFRVKNWTELAINGFFFMHEHNINNAPKKEVFKELRPIKGLAIDFRKNEQIFNGK